MAICEGSSGSFAGSRHRRIPLGYYYSALKNPISNEYQKSTSYELIKPFGALKIDQDRAKSFFHQYSVLQEKIKLIKSDICLPSDEVKGLKDISLLRIDVDFHNPTLLALEELYPKLVNGGYVIVGDYGLPFDCKDAVDAFGLWGKMSEAAVKCHKLREKYTLCKKAAAAVCCTLKITGFFALL